MVAVHTNKATSKSYQVQGQYVLFKARVGVHYQI